MASLANRDQTNSLLLQTLQRESSACRATALQILGSLGFEDIAPVTVYLPDSRDQDHPPGQTRFVPHKVTRFFVPAGKGTVGSQLKELLTEDTYALIKKKFWSSSPDLDATLPELSELVYFWNSHNKGRTWEAWNHKTSQQSDFDATGHSFGTDLVAVLFCARLVSRARFVGLNFRQQGRDCDFWTKRQANEFNLFSECEKEILKRLKHGVMRTFSGALSVDGDGNLSAHNSYDAEGDYCDPGPDCAAFGSPLPSKGKNLDR